MFCFCHSPKHTQKVSVNIRSALGVAGATETALWALICSIYFFFFFSELASENPIGPNGAHSESPYSCTQERVYNSFVVIKTLMLYRPVKSFIK